MQGSKYAPSDLHSVFRSIKEKLQNKKLVLFTGTPCQVHSLKCYLRKDYDSLITADLVCHGLPSIGIYQKFLDYYQKDEISVLDINFRNKSINGWNSLGSISLSNGKKIIIDSYNCAYYYYFDKGSISRDCCYSCKYSSSSDRTGDFTMGDFWGIEKCKEKPKSIQKGVSLVLVNSLKGNALLNKLSAYGVFVPNSFEFAQKENKQLISPINRLNKNPSLAKQTMIYGYKYMQQEFLKKDKNGFKHFCLLRIPSRIKYKIKRIL